MLTIDTMSRDELDELAVPEFDPSYLPETMQAAFAGNSYATIKYSMEEECLEPMVPGVPARESE